MKACIVLFGVLFTFPVNMHALPQQQSSATPVRDTVVVRKILSVVRAHVLSVTRNRRRPLVIREGKKSRRFIVMNFLEPVSLGKGIYTAQVDVDEFDHKIPRILYIDVKPYKKSFRVIRTRIGPNHFRDDHTRQEKFPSP